MFPEVENSFFNCDYYKLTVLIIACSIYTQLIALFSFAAILGKTAVDCTFFHKDFALFNENFLKPMQNLSFLTSITYNLPPSTIHLVNVEVQMVHEALCLEVGWIFEVARMRVDFSEVSVSEPLIGQEFIEQPIKNAVSYRHLKFCQSAEWPIILNSNAHIFWPKGAQKCAHPNFSKKRTNAHIFWPKGAQKCAHMS